MTHAGGLNMVDVTMIVIVMTLASAFIARGIETPAPVVLAAMGLAIGVLWHAVPGLPLVSVPADRVLFAFLPPLLTAASYNLPLGALRRNLEPITILAVGLVLATTTCVALVAHAVAGMPWAFAFLLGAIVSPPDPVAATAVAAKTGLSHRLVVILEGEGLMNDAVAIVAYKIALAAVLTGVFSWQHTITSVLAQAPIGLVIGFAMGWLVSFIRRRVDDVALEVGVTLIVPFITYELAERLGGSAVVAVVVFGLMLRYHSNAVSAPATRLAARTVWSAVQVWSTSLVFFVLGMLIGEIAVTDLSPHTLLTGGVVAVTVIVLRLAWMFSVPRVVHVLSRRQSAPPPASEMTVLAWAGMRGAVSLALALAVPGFHNAEMTRARHDILFTTFAIILATLLLQGATLLPLIRRLGLADPDRDERDEEHVRSRARRAGLASIARALRNDPSLADSCTRLSSRIEDGSIGIATSGPAGSDADLSHHMIAVLRAQRRVVERMRDRGLSGPAVSDELITELDVEEMELLGDTHVLTSAD